MPEMMWTYFWLPY